MFLLSDLNTNNEVHGKCEQSLAVYGEYYLTFRLL